MHEKQKNHGPTLQEVQASIADHYGHGWLSARESDAKTIQSLREALAQAQQENEQWRTWGVIEIAIRNVNVASYMNEWEGRALKAETQLAALTAQQETP